MTDPDRMERPLILTFVRHYLPGYKAGGPIRTIANLAAKLGDEFDFRVVTSDRDASDIVRFPEIGEETGWRAVGKTHVLYLRPEEKGLGHIARIMRETPHDVLYLNSYFDPDFTIKPLVARRLRLAPRRRTILAPRGEFSPNALRIRAAKKKAYLAAAWPFLFCADLEWQASSERESRDINRVIGKRAQTIRIAIDLPDAIRSPDTPHSPREEGTPLRICFLSRISPMKNLDYALEVLCGVSVPVEFDIYGPVRDEEYWAGCRKLMAQLPDNVSARYRGGVENSDVESVMARYDLFFLPTRGENYGHAILEALSAGTPVLIADTTPWRGLANYGVGWDLPLADAGAFCARIEAMAKVSEAGFADMSRAALSFAEAHRADPVAVEDNRALFRG